MGVKRDTRKHGFTLVEFMVVMFCLAVLVLLLAPHHVKGKRPSQRIRCTSHLKQTGLAFRQWAIDHNDHFPMSVPATNGAMEAVLAGDVAMMLRVMSNELNTPKILVCPADQRRVAATVFDLTAPRPALPFVNNSNVSYFVGVDASESARRWCSPATTTGSLADRAACP